MLQCSSNDYVSGKDVHRMMCTKLVDVQIWKNKKLNSLSLLERRECAWQATKTPETRINTRT